MKVKRYKHCRKVLTFYQKNFGFSVPYKVLIDGTFCKAALKFKVNIREQLPKYFQSEVQLCTTECATAECEALGLYICYQSLISWWVMKNLLFSELLSRYGHGKVCPSPIFVSVYCLVSLCSISVWVSLSSVKYVVK